ncbi:peptidase S41 [Brevundimonas variabilis]|uniref:Carboxyl-terminal processing protease n=1 Tax=Brevundimonas variabilis TaxID=74312 RepID=A0A7W9FGC8_9CAUL|nr:peptidase S41 [Brevundimonas variabilis]MBB5746518.1 carboxyl-terminal processing protease [Brevundimonas variabilis]
MRHRFSGLVLAAAILSIAPQVFAQTAEDYRRDALSVDPLIAENYAYLDRFPAEAAPSSDRLRAEAEAVHDARSLVRYAERRLSTLADPHAITNRSLGDSWALTPSYADLWIEHEASSYRVTAVRPNTQAAAAGIVSGDVLLEIEDVAMSEAIDAYWHDLGVEAPPDGAGYAARVLAAGRRDRPRRMAIRNAAGEVRTLNLPNLYAVPRNDRPPVSVSRSAEGLTIVFNDALGDNATLAAFDVAMSQARPGETVILDLADTPSGGNTVVARAIMGWFVSEARPYQIHRQIAEERLTGIPRQWIEELLPRDGRHHSGPVKVRVSRWTGSMGEGLAIGMDAIGAEVSGCPMAGLLGAVYDFRLEHSGLVLKLPTERLSAVNGLPREDFACSP